MGEIRILIADFAYAEERANKLLNALEELYAMVKGECPSLLEDNFQDEMIRAAIRKAKEGEA
jgi:hypothetical protein